MTLPGFQPIDRITHRAALVGRVIDSLTQIAVDGAEVTIVDGPAPWKARLAALQQGRPGARPDVQRTDATGRFLWLDLPAGTYSVRAALAGLRYASSTTNVNVAATGAVFNEIALVATALSGTIKADQPAGPLAMARVRFVDSGETTYTNALGAFTLSPLEPGTNRKLEVSAQKYQTTTQLVTLQSGKTTTLAAITLKHT